MRQIGQLESEKDARAFGDFLYVQGIENQTERDGNGWAIWIHSDDQILGHLPREVDDAVVFDGIGKLAVRIESHDIMHPLHHSKKVRP